jgi:predicted alpha/beta hydrolase family esterase
MAYKIADLDLLIVPGWSDSGPDHWQSRWARQMKSARRIEQKDWLRPLCADWVERIVTVIGEGTRPAVLIAHSCGVSAVVHAAQRLAGSRVRGAFLVGPPDLECTDRDWPEPGGFWPARHGGFLPLPAHPLPFPSLVVASRNDPFVSFERAQEFAADWGADFADAGMSGHINAESGHGPWPEGLLKLGQFLKRLH